MASVGTKFTMILRDSDSGNTKTINVTNPNDTITAAQVNTFVEEYDGVYTNGTWALGTCYYEDVTHRPLSS